MSVRDGLGGGPTFMTRQCLWGSSRSPSATRACPSSLAALPGNEQDRAKVRTLVLLSRSIGRPLTVGCVQWRDVGEPPVDAVRHMAGMSLPEPACLTEASQESTGVWCGV